MTSIMSVDWSDPRHYILSCCTSLTYIDQSDSRFMIDYQTYSKMHPSAAAFQINEADKLPFDTRPLYLDLDSTSSADICCLMPPDTYGFYFAEKKWSQYPQPIR